MKSTLDFVKKNWLIIGLIILVLFAWKSKRIDFFGYKHQINALTDSIVLLEQRRNLAEEREAVAKELILGYEFELEIYQDSINIEKEIIIKQKRKHAKEVADLKRIPTDTLYIDVTKWIDSLSIIW